MLILHRRPDADVLSWHEYLTSEHCSAQIHLLRNGSVCVFSRNCEDRSQAFPDVATAIRTAAEGGLVSSHVISVMYVNPARKCRGVSATTLVRCLSRYLDERRKSMIPLRHNEPG